eukprot:jgi/Undpi1/3330/HiC_scaffold_15.g06703.m1
MQFSIFLLACVAFRAGDAFCLASFGMSVQAEKFQAANINRNSKQDFVHVSDAGVWHKPTTATAAAVAAVRRGEDMTRARLVNVLGAAMAVSLGMSVSPSTAAARSTEELVRLVSAAKKQLDPVDQMITDAKWDSIRTTIKTAPLAEIKNVIAELAKQSGDDEALLLGMRQDVLDHVQYLDSFSYNNVFIGEERRILGTKIDFDTPRLELRQCREAFDIILEVLTPVE